MKSGGCAQQYADFFLLVFSLFFVLLCTTPGMYFIRGVTTVLLVSRLVAAV